MLIAIPLVLSAFSHIWNPVGFPSMYIDESHYMRRAMQVLQGMGPQEPRSVYVYPYDHPYFGQLFLAAMLKLVDYPAIVLNQFNPSSSHYTNTTLLVNQVIGITANNNDAINAIFLFLL